MTASPASTASRDRFPRLVLLIAGLVGIVEVAPLYFYEGTLNRTAPPALTHPEFYYGFIGIVLAWQVAFLIMSRDPARYRALMPALFLEKLLYPAAVFALYARGRVGSPTTLATAALDLVWLALFVAVWARLGRAAASAGPGRSGTA